MCKIIYFKWSKTGTNRSLTAFKRSVPSLQYHGTWETSTMYGDDPLRGQDTKEYLYQSNFSDLGMDSLMVFHNTADVFKELNLPEPYQRLTD